MYTFVQLGLQNGQITTRINKRNWVFIYLCSISRIYAFCLQY